jgi:hemerythrin-like metal-binding protein
MIKWDKRYELSIATIDDQHKKWIELMERVRQSAEDSQKLENISNILSEMVAYAGFHFQYEERLFKELGYAETKAHEQRHRDFERNVVVLQEALKAGQIPMVATLLKDMQTWLIEHICQEDKKYAALFQAKGIK